MTNAEARFNKSLRPRKPEGSLGRTAQDSHLNSHTAPELCQKQNNNKKQIYIVPPSTRHPHGILGTRQYLFGDNSALNKFNEIKLHIPEREKKKKKKRKKLILFFIYFIFLAETRETVAMRTVNSLVQM